MFVARALIGILSSAVLPSSTAYIGESTTDKERGGMGKMGAAVGIGMILGPGVGGALAKDSFMIKPTLLGVLRTPSDCAHDLRHMTEITCI